MTGSRRDKDLGVEVLRNESGDPRDVSVHGLNRRPNVDGNAEGYREHGCGDDEVAPPGRCRGMRGCQSPALPECCERQLRLSEQEVAQESQRELQASKAQGPDARFGVEWRNLRVLADVERASQEDVLQSFKAIEGGRAYVECDFTAASEIGV